MNYINPAILKNPDEFYSVLTPEEIFKNMPGLCRTNFIIFIS